MAAVPISLLLVATTLLDALDSTGSITCVLLGTIAKVEVGADGINEKEDEGGVHIHQGGGGNKTLSGIPGGLGGGVHPIGNPT